LKSFNIVLRTKDNNWKIENLTDNLEKQVDNLEKQVDNVISKINDYKMVLQKDESSLLMGEHCNKPYQCEFVEYCKSNC
jgi:hypothetical protein